MIMTLGHNMSRQVADAGFFEIGRVFTRAEDGATREGEHLAIGLMGKIGRTGLDRQRAVEPDEMFRWLKGVIEALWALQSGGPLTLLPETRDAMEPGWSVRIECGGRVVGWAGLLTAAIRDEWRIAEPVGVAELDMEALLAGRSRAMRLEPVPAYPAIRHDVALIVEERIRHEDLVAVIRRAGPAELTEVALFDIFRGGSVGDGRKSMAYTLTYRAPDRTLKDEDANRFDEAIRAALRQELGAEIREG
jgi:phenylalanyl-tRNA synthetase beta chain